MGKHRTKYGVSNAFNISIAGEVGHVPVKKKAILAATDSYISKRIENQEIGLPVEHGWIYDIPSSVRKAYNKMSNAEQLLFWATLGAIGGFALGDYITKGPYKNDFKKAYEKAGKYFSQSNSKTVAPVVAPVINKSVKLTPTLQPTESAYQFTPDIRIHGSDEYKQKTQFALKELDKTPNFKIENMTARQYVEKYIDDLYEAVPGTRENCPPEAIGKQATVCLNEQSIEPSTLLHVARHQEQTSDLIEQFGGKQSYDLELDAVKFQSEWMAVRNNWTEEQRQKWFDNSMKYYEPWKSK